ncbi:hypothetical protein LCGC14_2935140 [marine sediment metagenome]|uniref:Uncharacterized protein n=1 Tax=marine sediment metagenome TaxID=412755 RepID=A0A0F8ZSC2_9ZZZZ
MARKKIGRKKRLGFSRRVTIGSMNFQSLPVGRLFKIGSGSELHRKINRGFGISLTRGKVKRIGQTTQVRQAQT